ncbi:alpha/beta fold hydrolase [Pontibacter sp. SGAir0037]|uniref:alpha/beta fold hydrolase n=1 Tax=Pontibacter sp. SGAir0037 TaxID=2571030 RepID=UPI0010CCBB9E|nr:alpha/beta fold hydrolase [Pontibacter sp. SGAir0037]QCR24451.1 alpha/beta hydrolase [Pontibacter sp. SGAir0037]
MNRFPLLFLISLLVHTAFAQQLVKSDQVIGDWGGIIDPDGAKLNLIFHIKAAEDGSLAATMDIPGQGAADIPAKAVRLTSDSLYLDFSHVGGIKYAGKITGPETIDGHWKQAGMSVPVPISKGAAAAMRKPQEPQRPFPYQEKEVAVENKDAGITLAGTLTLPQGKGPHAAVILFTGSGAQDRDMSLLGHKPFLVLADHLTRQGIAVLRLDDRGAGKSGGNPTTATTKDFTSDGMAAYAFLKTQAGINPKKIGVLGISEGANIAASVAAQHADVAFVVLMAGGAVPGTELLLAQNEAIFKQAVADPALLQKLLNLRKAQFEIAATEQDVFEASKKIRQLEQEAKTRLNEQEKAQLGLTPQSEQALVAQLSSPWMRYYLAYDPAPALQKLKMPVLALNGSKDVQVPAAQNLPATEKALKAGGNKKYTVKELPGLNHIFQTATTGLHTEYAKIQETMAPVALDTITQWVKGVVK